MGQTAGLKHITDQLDRHQLLLLDGAVGTELERRGYNTFLPLWTARAIEDCPELLGHIHEEYIASGADIITANTFRTSGYTLQKAGIRHRARTFTEQAVEIAREAANRSEKDIAIAGSLAPLEDCYSPHLVPSEEVVRREFSAQIEILAESGVDFILLETMINRLEIEVITAELHANQIPFMISFTAGEDGNILDGTPLNDVLQIAVQRDPIAVLLNCRTPSVITQNLDIVSNAGVHFGAYGNGLGTPGGPTGWNWDHGEMSEVTYRDEALRWHNLGARIIGGCCGTSPSTIHLLNTLRE